MAVSSPRQIDGWSACTALTANDIVLVQGNNLANTYKATTTTLTSYFDTNLAGKQTKWIPARDMLSAVTNGPAAGTLETTTNQINYEVLDFDDGADEYAHFNVAFPKSWNLGTVTFQVWWSSTATDTDGVAWGLQGVAVSDNVTADTAFGTPVVITDNAQLTAGEVYVTPESTAVTISNAPADADICYFRVFRDIDDPADVHEEDARLIGIKLFFTEDTLVDI